MQIKIFHNPDCGTSRNVLAAIRAAGHEPVVLEYLKTPLSREQIARLIALAGISPRDAVRRKEKLYSTLGLDGKGVSADQLLDAMAEHPVLLNRPFVEVERNNGKLVARLCRPSELVKTLIAEEMRP